MKSMSIARARRAWSPPSRSIEALEPRRVPSAVGASAPAVRMISATTADSKSVTIEYQVNQPVTAASPLQFGVYRSSDGRFGPDDSAVDTMMIVPTGVPGRSPTLDQSGAPATSVGTHTMTIALPGGLPPYPMKPFVTVVVDPSSPSAADPGQSASFCVETIGVVTHGGIQDPSWTHGPPWELEIAYMMRHQGFDAVIPYNWALVSGTPGTAIKQSPRLARIILATANRFPAGSVVDLEMIGHSEGTVINTYALATLQRELTPGLRAGYVEDTLLDPHAANNDVVQGKQMDFAGPLAGLGKMVVTDYQRRAGDPPPYFPSIVDQANVFFQHSQATDGGIYNLWGQVPVRSEGPTVHYYNLTAMDATHSGKTGVNYWYRDFIAPTLGNGAPLVRQLPLDGQVDNAQPVPSPTPRAAVPTNVVATRQPEFSGTAAPGSAVRLLIGPGADPSQIAIVGVTRADASGQWSVTPRRPLAPGQYRAVVTAFSRALRTRPGLAIVPTQPLGRVVVP